LLLKTVAEGKSRYIKTSGTAGLYQRDMTYKEGAPDKAKEKNSSKILLSFATLHNISPINKVIGLSLELLKNMKMKSANTLVSYKPNQTNIFEPLPLLHGSYKVHQ
jgi:hypothetical protein